jgi:hypothetical protein
MAKAAHQSGELIFTSASTLAQAIRNKEVSSEEEVKAYLQRIEAVNPKINAVVQLPAEKALEEAREADAALARGELKGSLHGVPFTVKDNIETAGVICTAGTKGRASFVPTRDATIVARLRAAGAILLGKTNLPELGLAAESDNLATGGRTIRTTCRVRPGAVAVVRGPLSLREGLLLVWAMMGEEASAYPLTFVGLLVSSRLQGVCPGLATSQALKDRLGSGLQARWQDL